MLVVSFLSFIGVVWSVIVNLTGGAVAGWASMVSILCFLGGIQLLSLGILGEYIGKIYLEVKARPRYIISERTYPEGVNSGECDSGKSAMEKAEEEFGNLE